MDNRYIGKTCPFCKTPFKEDDVIVTCSICDMPHHLSCWQENNGCTTFGCTGAIKETFGISRPESTSTSNSAKTLATELLPQQDASTRRYETLYENEPLTIQEGIPVITEKVALIIDNQKHSLMARCTFRSLSDKPIMAMLVDVKCTDVWGQASKTVEGFQFLDLKTKRDSTFGQTTPIPIPDSATRIVDVVIKKVLFTDRSIVEGTATITTLPKQDTLSDYFGDGELAQEFKRESTEHAKYNVISGETYWRCTCGAINFNKDSNCYRCKSEKAALMALMDSNFISGNLAAYKEEKRIKAEKEQAEREEQLRQAEERMRLAQEEKERQEREEAERKSEELRLKKEKRKKTTKKSLLILAATLMVAFLVYATGWHIIPYVKYTNACNSLEAGAFDEAYNAFVTLGDFSDSSDKAIDTLYQKATFLMNSGSYTDAAVEFEKVPTYLDSKKQATYCRNEAAYLAAEKLFDEGKYHDAADAWTALGDYSDSADCANEANYKYANELLEKGEYDKAYSYFKALSSYKDSADQAKESEYLYAIECFDNGDYKNAVDAFTVVKDYKDVSERLPEAKYNYAGELAAKSEWKDASTLYKALGDYKDSATQYEETYYQYGLKLLDSKSYKDAVTVFDSLKNYQESKAKLNEAKYGYVIAHKNSTDTTTYKYLKELKSAGYKDSKDIYNKLYAWTVKIIINDSETNETTNKSSISKYKTVYCHVTLQGGPPGEGINLRYSYTWPGSASNGDSWNWTWYDGSEGWFNTWYNTPAYGYTGTFSARVYDKSTGDLLGSATVTITN